MRKKEIDELVDDQKVGERIQKALEKKIVTQEVQESDPKLVEEDASRGVR